MNTAFRELSGLEFIMCFIDESAECAIIAAERLFIFDLKAMAQRRVPRLRHRAAGRPAGAAYLRYTPCLYRDNNFQEDFSLWRWIGDRDGRLRACLRC